MTAINKEALYNELLFFWLKEYIRDDKIKNKLNLLCLEEVEEVEDELDNIIKWYLDRKKFTIKYVGKSEKYDEYIWIFKWKKLVVALNVEDRFLLTNEDNNNVSR